MLGKQQRVKELKKGQICDLARAKEKKERKWLEWLADGIKGSVRRPTTPDEPPTDQTVLTMENIISFHQI